MLFSNEAETSRYITHAIPHPLFLWPHKTEWQRSLMYIMFAFEKYMNDKRTKVTRNHINRWLCSECKKMHSHTHTRAKSLHSEKRDHFLSRSMINDVQLSFCVLLNGEKEHLYTCLSIKGIKVMLGKILHENWFVFEQMLHSKRLCLAYNNQEQKNIQ